MKPTFAQALAELVSNRTVWVPVLIWFAVQLWKVISSGIETGFDVTFRASAVFI
jgi:hypothetical protein